MCSRECFANDFGVGYNIPCTLHPANAYIVESDHVEMPGRTAL